MKKTWKKIISLLLSMLMLFGIMPLSIYASADSKIEADLREDLAEMEMDDEIVIWIWLKSKTTAEINQMLLDETGMDADLYQSGKASYDAEKYLAARRAIVKREHSAVVEQFKEKYLQDRLVVYSGM